MNKIDLTNLSFDDLLNVKEETTVSKNTDEVNSEVVQANSQNVIKQEVAENNINENVAAQQISLIGDAVDVDKSGKVINNKPESENKKASSSKKESSSKKSDSEVVGPRIVKAYGDELWVENNVNVTNEQIRQRIVNEFGYTEFSKDKTVFDYNKETGILDVGKMFHKKG